MEKKIKKYSKDALERRLERLEESLRKERQRQTEVWNRQGFGHAQRHSKAGISFRREDELKEKIDNVKRLLREVNDEHNYAHALVEKMKEERI